MEKEGDPPSSAIQARAQRITQIIPEGSKLILSARAQTELQRNGGRMDRNAPLSR